MKYRINDVKNFVETSSCSTIVQSSQRLEISQPALSESLKRLEMDLGCILFYRSRSGIQLTPSGKLFLRKAQNALRAFHELDMTLESGNIFSGRTIVIGCHPTVAQYSIPKALSYLKTKAPDYKIELRHDLSRNIQAEIQRGNIDIGMVINPAEVPDLVIQKLDIDIVGIWSPKTSEELDTVICNPNLFQTQSILKKWKEKPQKIISTDSLELICRLVNEKIGFGILPERAVRLSGFSLRHFATLPSYKDEICLVYRPEFGKVPAEKVTAEALRKSMT
ncbi:MAG: LysR family transcriptional regulator [Bdellovibrionales bacterium]|nr:LysR family transcriptional regulator [Bdellovibrionales bacterium]